MQKLELIFTLPLDAIAKSLCIWSKYEYWIIIIIAREEISKGEFMCGLLAETETNTATAHTLGWLQTFRWGKKRKKNSRRMEELKDMGEWMGRGLESRQAGACDSTKFAFAIMLIVPIN